MGRTQMRTGATEKILAVSAEATEKILAMFAEATRTILDEKLEPLHLEILQLKTELRRETRRPRADSIDPRKMFIAEIIKDPKPYRKMNVLEILREADKRQHRSPENPYFRPVPAWKVHFWSDMKRDNRVQSYIGKIRADPRYLPYEYLSELGKKRFKMNREYCNE